MTFPDYMKPVTPDPLQLTEIEMSMRRVGDLKQELAGLEERMAWVKQEIAYEERENLPEMFRGRITHHGVAAIGNNPPLYGELKPFFSAGIAASWPFERQAAGFNYLEQTGNGGLIKATVVVNVPTKSQDVRKQLFTFCDQHKLDFEAKLSVHHGTLTSWLKKEVEAGRLPKLDLIGGTVGEIVKVEPQKEK